MAVTQINGNQVKPSSIGIVDLSATGTANSTTFLRGDNSWAVPSGGSGITRSILSISSTTTGAAVASTDYVYLCTGTFTFTMPTAVSNTNCYLIKNVGTGTITITFNGVETGEGDTTGTLYNGEEFQFISDNTNWKQI